MRDGARRADLSISAGANLLGSSHATISRVYREKRTISKTATYYTQGMQKISSEHTTCQTLRADELTQKTSLCATPVLKEQEI